ncbi:hypothetical protein GCM10027180_01080 [Microbulbifer echini]
MYRRVYPFTPFLVLYWFKGRNFSFANNGYLALVAQADDRPTPRLRLRAQTGIGIHRHRVFNFSEQG